MPFWVYQITVFVLEHAYLYRRNSAICVKLKTKIKISNLITDRGSTARSSVHVSSDLTIPSDAPSVEKVRFLLFLWILRISKIQNNLVLERVLMTSPVFADVDVIMRILLLGVKITYTYIERNIRNLVIYERAYF
jgi:hypothetical protein